MIKFATRDETVDGGYKPLSRKERNRSEGGLVERVRSARYERDAESADAVTRSAGFQIPEALRGIKIKPNALARLMAGDVQGAISAQFS